MKHATRRWEIAQPFEKGRFQMVFFQITQRRPPEAQSKNVSVRCTGLLTANILASYITRCFTPSVRIEVESHSKIGGDNHTGKPIRDGEAEALALAERLTALHPRNERNCPPAMFGTRDVYVADSR